MKSLKNQKNSTYSISGLTAREFRALNIVVKAATRCFPENYKYDEDFYSNDDFVCILNGYEVDALRRIAKEL